MKVVILAGGEGKRLRPYTNILPKPLLPIGEKPILEVILERLKKQGIIDVVLATNYKDHLIKTFFGSGEEFGMKIQYSGEEFFLGTAGPLKSLEGTLGEDFFVMNGDLLNKVDIWKVLDFHKKNHGDMTIITKKIKNPINYGVIENKGILAVEWKEKPEIAFEISTGMYMLNKKVLKHIPPKTAFNMNDLFAEVLKNDGRVLRFPYRGEWIDIGRIEDYQKANLKEGKR